MASIMLQLDTVHEERKKAWQQVDWKHLVTYVSVNNLRHILTQCLLFGSARHITLLIK